MGQTNEALRSMRAKKGFSQERLGEQAGVPQESVSKLENRGPTRAILNAILIARALGTSVEDLFGGHLPRAPAKTRKRTAVHAPGCERKSDRTKR